MDGSPRPLAITGVTLIDGTGRPPLGDATVVIDGDRIARAGPSAEGPPPDGAQIIDGRGRFLIPGLTDMHVHVLGPDRWHAPLFLAAGVTTVLDLGGQLGDLTALRDAIDAAATPGPRLLYTGPFLEEAEPYAGFAHMSRRVDAARIGDAVDELADAGVHAIKLYVTITPGTARRACARARERGLRVFMHQQETWGADAADAGVDCVEHMMVFGALAPEAIRPPAPGRLTPFEYGGWMWRWLADVDPRDAAVSRLFDRLIAADTALDPTLVLFAARPGALGDDVGDTGSWSCWCAPVSRRWTRCSRRPVGRPPGSIAPTNSESSPRASRPTSCCSAPTPWPTSATSGPSSGSWRAGASTTRRPWRGGLHDPQTVRDGGQRRTVARVSSAR